MASEDYQISEHQRRWFEKERTKMAYTTDTTSFGAKLADSLGVNKSKRSLGVSAQLAQNNHQHQNNHSLSTSAFGSAPASVAYTEPETIKDHISEKIEEVKELVKREADQDNLQDLIDLTRVMIEEIRGIRKDIKDSSATFLPQHQPMYPTPVPPSVPWASTGTVSTSLKLDELDNDLKIRANG